MAKRAVNGSGSVRKKTVCSGGRTYRYWEARLTVGHDPVTGRQIQRSFSGKTQREVREKMQAAAAEVRGKRCIVPSRQTLGDWLDEWLDEFLCAAKPATRSIYENNIKNHIKPALGAIRLAELRPDAVQRFIGGLQTLSPASVRLAYKVLRQSLAKAVALGYLAANPADGWPCRAWNSARRIRCPTRKAVYFWPPCAVRKLSSLSGWLYSRAGD